MTTLEILRALGGNRDEFARFVCEMKLGNIASKFYATCMLVQTELEEQLNYTPEEANKIVQDFLNIVSKAGASADAIVRDPEYKAAVKDTRNKVKRGELSEDEAVAYLDKLGEVIAKRIMERQ